MNERMTSSRVLRGYQKDKNPTNCFMGFIRKPSCELLEMFLLQIPPAGPHILPSCSYLPVYAPESSKCKPLQVTCEHVQKAGSTLWDWEKVHKLER